MQPEPSVMQRAGVLWSADYMVQSKSSNHRNKRVPAPTTATPALHRREEPTPSIEKAGPSDWPDDSTTVMLRNIPNRYTQEDLLEELHGKGHHAAFDYFHLVMDMQTKRNKGFAFLNLRSPALARQIYAEFHGIHLERYRSHKVIEVTLADVQGFNLNAINYLKVHGDRVQNAWFKPIIFVQTPSQGQKPEWKAFPLSESSLPEEIAKIYRDGWFRRSHAADGQRASTELWHRDGEAEDENPSRSCLVEDGVAGPRVSSCHDERDRATLAAMATMAKPALREMAKALGASSTDMENAIDAEDTKQALIDIIVNMQTSKRTSGTTCQKVFPKPANVRLVSGSCSGSGIQERLVCDSPQAGLDTSNWPLDATTVMLRNIPSRYTQEDLLEELADRGFCKMFDYFHLVIDMETKRNKGFAFLNLRSAALARQIYTAFHGVRLQRYNALSRKVLEVALAEVQGLHANAISYLIAHGDRVTNAWFRPVIFVDAPGKNPDWIAVPLIKSNLPDEIAQLYSSQSSRNRCAASSVEQRQQVLGSNPDDQEDEPLVEGEYGEITSQVQAFLADSCSGPNQSPEALLATLSKSRRKHKSKKEKLSCATKAPIAINIAQSLTEACKTPSTSNDPEADPFSGWWSEQASAVAAYPATVWSCHHAASDAAAPTTTWPAQPYDWQPHEYDWQPQQFDWAQLQ